MDYRAAFCSSTDVTSGAVSRALEVRSYSFSRSDNLDKHTICRSFEISARRASSDLGATSRLKRRVERLESTSAANAGLTRQLCLQALPASEFSVEERLAAVDEVRVRYAVLHYQMVH